MYPDPAAHNLVQVLSTHMSIAPLFYIVQDRDVIAGLLSSGFDYHVDGPVVRFTKYLPKNELTIELSKLAKDPPDSISQSWKARTVRAVDSSMSSRDPVFHREILATEIRNLFEIDQNTFSHSLALSKRC